MFAPWREQGGFFILPGRNFFHVFIAQSLMKREVQIALFYTSGDLVPMNGIFVIFILSLVDLLPNKSMMFHIIMISFKIRFNSSFII